MAITTLETFKGTTAQVHAALASDIGDNTVVTITDSEYTLKDADTGLLAIIAKVGQNKVILEMSDKALSGDSADLIKMLAGVSSYTGDLTVEPASEVSAADLNTIAKGTTGKVTATLSSDTPLNADTVDDLADVEATDVITFKPTATTADAAILVAINKIISGADFTAVTTITAAAADVALVKEALAYSTVGEPAVTITEAISAADAKTIAAATEGVLTATIDAGTVASLAALTDTNTSDILALTVNDASLTAAGTTALVALLEKTGGKIKVDATAVTGTIEDLTSIYVTNKAKFEGLGNEAVTITGSISATDAKTIAAATEGVLTATITGDTAANLLTALGDTNTSDDILALTVNDQSLTAAGTTALVSLLEKTGGKIKVDAKAVTGSIEDLTSIYVTNKDKFTNLGDEAITISGSSSAEQLNAIAAATTGKVTATLAADTKLTKATVDALADVKATDDITFVPTDTNADASALIAIKKIIKDATFTNVTTIEADAADVALVKEALAIKPNSAVTIVDDAISAADLNAIAKGTTGKVTATLSSDTPLNADTVAALKDVNSKDVIAFEVTEVKSKEEISALLNLKKILSTLIIDLETIEADAKDIALVKDVLKHSPDAAVTINGEISAADANIIAKSGDGALTATIKAGSVAATLKAIKDVDSDDVITFKTTDKSADASELVTLAAIVHDFDASSVKTITAKSTTNVALALAIAEDAAVTITGNVAVGDIQAILDATTGKVTATLVAGEAGNIVTALDDNQVNAINVTVIGTTASAENLLDIKDLTSGKITVTAKEVSGSFDDLKELYVTSKGKFTALGDENVTITGTVSAADANIIAKAVNGKVTATLEDNTAAALVASLKDAKATNALTLTVIGESAKASELNVLDGKTSGTVTVNGNVVISGNIADLTKVFATGSGIITDNNAVTILGTVSAKDANKILDATDGKVTATIAADTAAKLVSALEDSTDNVLNLTVNGAKADAGDLKALLGKTTEKITVTAKEISGSLTDITKVLVTEAKRFTGLDKVAVKITDAPVALADLDDLDAILAATSGIVTATVASGAADVLVAALENAKATDALKLTVAAGEAKAAKLLALDGKTSVVVDAKAASITGTAADVKKLLASKGVSLDKNVAIKIEQDTEVSAADVNAIAKATGGIVTATVAAGTAAALNKALGNATKNDAITLEVSGKTATASDLLALDGKTSVKVGAAEVESITGTVADLKKVFAAKTADTLELAADVAVSVSGTVKASDLKDVLTAADGIVTATVAAGKAAELASALVTNKNPDDALKVTITDTKVDAADLVKLDGATSIAVNAASVNTITGKAEDVFAAYEANADKGISGLGNEAVDLTDATDANAELVSAINDFTTGLIKLPTVTFDDVATTFSLSDLGDLKGITGLTEINADNGEADFINISIKDLLAANDSKEDFDFTIKGGDGDGDKVEFSDISGWTQKTIVDGYTFTNDKTDQIITVNLVDAVLAV